MTLIHDLTPNDNGNGPLILGDAPVVQLRLRVQLASISTFLSKYVSTFLPVDATLRETLIFLFDDRSHFNVMILYKYPDWDTYSRIHDLYPKKWAKHYKITVKSAPKHLHKKETELYTLVEDDERLLMRGYSKNPW